MDSHTERISSLPGAKLDSPYKSTSHQILLGCLELHLCECVLLQLNVFKGLTLFPPEY
jgi:hypothetical protein